MSHGPHDADSGRTDMRSRPKLDPDLDEQRRLAARALELLLLDQSRISQSRVARRRSSAELDSAINEPLPGPGTGADDSLDFFFQRIVPAMTRVNHPRFHAFVPVPGSFYGLLGEMMTAAVNPFAGSWLGSTSFATLELLVLRWIAEAVGYPADSPGILTSGGSIANLIGLAAARQKFGDESLERGVLYVSDQGHHSFTKAASVLGFRPRSIRTLESDRDFQLDPRAVERAVAADRRAGLLPMVISANAGTTNTGAVDPLEDLADLCAQNQLWFHVDGAYGGFAAICHRGRQLLQGMERADSLTLDPHKWLYTPMGVGCALCRDRSLLEAAFQSDGQYLRDVPRNEVNFYDRGPELSRPARAVSVWMLLRSAGLDGVRDQIEHDLSLANLAEQRLAEDDLFEIVRPTVLSIVVFRHRQRPGENETDRAARDLELIEAILEDGTLMLSSTELEGRTALRMAIMNHRTDQREVERSVNKIRSLAARLDSAPTASSPAVHSLR